MRSHYKFWAVETLKINQCPQYLMQTIWYKEVRQLIWRLGSLGVAVEKGKGFLVPRAILFLPKWKLLSCVRLFATPWAIQSMEFSRPEYWSGEPFPSPGDLPNPGLRHCRRILYQLSYKGSPRILEWVVYPFSSRSSQPRNQTRVFCIAGGFFTNWAIRESLFERCQL